MCSWLGRSVTKCLRPFGRYARMNRDDDGSAGGDHDPFLWSKDLERHSHGEFSFAVVQANDVLEDQSQVQTGREATFVGVYDGHGGVDAANYICDNLFRHLLRFAKENKTLSADIIRNAVSETENGFLTLVRRAFEIIPLIAAVGSCCLVGVIWNQTLYTANLGDSRAVLGYLEGTNRIVAEQLTQDHNASIEEVRRELQSLHPNDPNIVTNMQGAWRVKGIIQITRSIGDAYLKKSELSLGPAHPRFHIPGGIREPILRADPAMLIRDLQPSDRFVIFASDGLWENLSNQEAVEIVHNNPRVGIAKRLIVSSLEKAGRVRGTTYNGIQKSRRGERRNYHDDISVVVLFIDHALMGNNDVAPQVSVRGFVDAVGPSNFDF